MQEEDWEEVEVEAVGGGAVTSSGIDMFGSRYAAIEQLWKIKPREDWYEASGKYWSQIEPSMEGIMGGYPQLHAPDCAFSIKTVKRLRKEVEGLGAGHVLDCGAGWGRVTQGVLLNLFDRVSLLQPNPLYIQKAKKLFAENEKVRDFYNQGLQEFQFGQKYDCVWVQWVANYLTDQDLHSFLVRAREALRPGSGFVVVKENTTKAGFVYDNDDTSVTRSREMFIELFGRAGLRCLGEYPQDHWPQDMFPVVMFVLKPI